MPFEIAVGLEIVDHDKYAQYREEIAPSLEATGARFRHDFEVARTLKSDMGQEINRLFVLQLPDLASKERFFADMRYMEIRSRLFEKAVTATVVIAEFST